MKLIKSLAALILLLVITSVTVSNHSLDDSETVAQLSYEIKSLERANTILNAQIARSGSLTQAVDDITLAGFSDPEHIATLDSPGHVAQR